ncbi:MAG: hypothetical protein E7051_05215 [Lentisphaerae bacterium]|nr:hypothetical protein [Lentisphaerota bacterium]
MKVFRAFFILLLIIICCVQSESAEYLSKKTRLESLLDQKIIPQLELTECEFEDTLEYLQRYLSHHDITVKLVNGHRQIGVRSNLAPMPLVTVKIKDKTLRECLDEISDASGFIWRPGANYSRHDENTIEFVRPYISPLKDSSRKNNGSEYEIQKMLRNKKITFRKRSLAFRKGGDNFASYIHYLNIYYSFFLQDIDKPSPKRHNVKLKFKLLYENGSEVTVRRKEELPDISFSKKDITLQYALDELSITTGFEYNIFPDCVEFYVPDEKRREKKVRKNSVFEKRIDQVFFQDLMLKDIYWEIIPQTLRDSTKLSDITFKLVDGKPLTDVKSQLMNIPKFSLYVRNGSLKRVLDEMYIVSGIDYQIKNNCIEFVRPYVPIADGNNNTNRGIKGKLDKIIFPKVVFLNSKLTYVCELLSRYSNHINDGDGVKIIFTGETSPQVKKGGKQTQQVPEVFLSKRNTSLKGILDEISRYTGVKYIIKEDCIVFNLSNVKYKKSYKQPKSRGKRK